MYYEFRAPNAETRIGWTEDPQVAEAVAQALSYPPGGLVYDAEPITDDTVDFAKHLYGETLGDGSEADAMTYILGHSLVCDEDTALEHGQIVDREEAAIAAAEERMRLRREFP